MATSRPARARRLGPILGLAIAAILMVGCSSGPGTKTEFVSVLTRDGNLTDEEAQCIADEVFDEYEDDEDALGRISAAPSFEFLESEEGVAGFGDFFRATVSSCVQVGPVQS